MFEDSLKEGGMGEHTVWNLLTDSEKNPKIRFVFDVRKDKNYQAKDIDFLVENTNRQITPFEVKTDMQAHKTGNIVYEKTTSNHVGCFEKTQAHIIAYYIPGNQQVHMIRVSALRKYVQESKLSEVRMGDNATGYLLPIEDLKNNGVILKTFEGVM